MIAAVEDFRTLLRISKMIPVDVARVQRGIAVQGVQRALPHANGGMMTNFHENDYEIQQLLERPPDRSVFTGSITLTTEIAQSAIMHSLEDSRPATDVDRIAAHWYRSSSRPIKQLRLQVVVEYVQECPNDQYIRETYGIGDDIESAADGATDNTTAASSSS